MTLLRGHLLTIGPLALIALSYAIAAPSSASRPAADFSSIAPLSHIDESVSTEECQNIAENLKELLPKDWGIIVHPPFILAGDCDAKKLTLHFRQTISPTVRALSIQYFDLPPAWPITMVVCSSDESYHVCNQCLDKRERSEYSGVYSRRDHRVVVNMATGEGTLAHELTHALAHADFAELPEWLDEGMASLYEECEFSSDGFRLIGQENWRGSILRNAFQDGNLRPISALAREHFASSDRATVDYAQARYFCLFLQRHQLLEAFYRKCRQRKLTDPNGMATLGELFDTRDLRDVDRQFQDWFGRLKGRSADGD